MFKQCMLIDWYSHLVTAQFAVDYVAACAMHLSIIAAGNNYKINTKFAQISFVVGDFNYVTNLWLIY